MFNSLLERQDGRFKAVWSSRTWDAASAIVATEGYLYVLRGSSGLVVHDAVTLYRGGEIHHVEFPDFSPTDALLVGDLLYVVDTFGRLGVIDTSDPLQTPVLRGRVYAGLSAGRLALAPDGNLWLACRDQGVVKIGLDDPFFPTVLGNCMLPGTTTDVASGPGDVVVASVSGGVLVLSPDATDYRSATVSGWNIRGALARDGLLYTGEGLAFKIYRPGTDGRIDLLGQVDLTYPAFRFISDGRLAIVDEHYWLFEEVVELLDVSDPANPRVLRELMSNRISWQSFDGEIYGDTVLVAKAGLWVADVNAPADEWIYSDPRPIGWFEGLGDLGCMLINTPAYPYSHSFEVVDIRDLGSIRTVSALDFTGTLAGLAGRGDVVYVGQSSGGAFLLVIDISDPANPELAARIPVPGTITDLAVEGTILCAATGEGSILFDLQDPRSPQGIQHLLGGNVHQISIYGDVVFQEVDYHMVTFAAPCRDDLTVAVDIRPESATNPVNFHSRGILPVAVLTDAGFDARDVDVASVRFGPAGAEEAHRNGRRIVQHLEDVDGDGDTDLLLHFRIADTGLTPADTKARLSGRTRDGRRFSGSDSLRPVGREAVDKDVQPLVRATIHPNPFNPQTMVSLDLGRGDDVTVSVFDLRGRRIRILHAGALAAGAHSLIWNGRDDAGRDAPSGTYLFRIMTSADTHVQRGLLLR